MFVIRQKRSGLIQDMCNLSLKLFFIFRSFFLLFSQPANNRCPGRYLEKAKKFDILKKKSEKRSQEHSDIFVHNSQILRESATVSSNNFHISFKKSQVFLKNSSLYLKSLANSEAFFGETLGLATSLERDTQEKKAVRKAKRTNDPENFYTPRTTCH